VFFLSDTKDSGLIGQEYEKANFIDTECGAGEDDISRLCKNEFIVKLFLENYQERGYKWLFRVEDDSYIFVETLVEYLQTLDSTKPLAIGSYSSDHLSCITIGFDYNCGSRREILSS
jgi:hypothetical protein